MGIRNTSDEGKVALFDSVTGWAFGPIMDDATEAEAFITFAERHWGHNIQTCPDPILADLALRFRDTEASQT